jgi:hypothetical protein
MAVVIARYTQNIRLAVDENMFRTHISHHQILSLNDNDFIGWKKATFNLFLTKLRKTNYECP